MTFNFCFVLNKAVGLVWARQGKVPLLVFNKSCFWSFFVAIFYSSTSDPKIFALNHVPNLVTNVGQNLVTNSDAVSPSSVHWRPTMNLSKDVHNSQSVVIGKISDSYLTDWINLRSTQDHAITH